MKLSATLSATTPAALIERTKFLAHLSDEALRDRLAKLEEMGRRTAEKVARGERGDFNGTVVRKGRHVASYTIPAALNSQRNAWAQTRALILLREAGLAPRP